MESDLPFDLEARGCRPLQSSQHHPENQQEHTDVMIFSYRLLSICGLFASVNHPNTV